MKIKENQTCEFCHCQERGKPVAVCSRCVQELICASPVMIADAIERHRDTLTPGKLHFLQSIKDEEVNYEFKARKHRKNMERKRVSREVQPSRERVRAMYSN